MKNQYYIRVKDYLFYAEAKSNIEAKSIIFKLIQTKRNRYKEYLNISQDNYIITKQG